MNEQRLAALAGVLSRFSGMQGGFEFAHNFLTAVESAERHGEVVESATLLREMLDLRRESWPSRWEGRLTDGEIAQLAAEGGQAWERGARVGRAA